MTTITEQIALIDPELDNNDPLRYVKAKAFLESPVEEEAYKDTSPVSAGVADQYFVDNGLDAELMALEVAGEEKALTFRRYVDTGQSIPQDLWLLACTWFKGKLDSMTADHLAEMQGFGVRYKSRKELYGLGTIQSHQITIPLDARIGRSDIQEAARIAEEERIAAEGGE